MFKRIGLLILLLIALILSACGSRTGEVHGTIVDESGAMLTEKITVVLEPYDPDLVKDGKVTWSMEYSISDEYRERRQVLEIEEGEFLFTDVIPGYYSVTVELENSPSIVHRGPAFEVQHGEVIEQTITVE